MRELTWTLATLASHWRRNPVQLAAVLVGLALATALWSGVQAINAEARASYAKATALLGGPEVDGLRARDGGAIDQAVFVALRRAGIEVSPIIEGALPTGGRRLRILGIEPVSLPGPALPATLTTGGGGGTRTDAEAEPTGVPAFLRPPWQALASPETITELAGNTELPPRAEDRSLPPGLLVMDIGIAQQLLGLKGRLTRLVLAPGVEISEARLSEHGLSRIPAEEEGAEIGLTDSFHLNLTAFAFLSFAVGLLIVRAAIGLALEQRLATVRTLRACGVSARQITLAVLIEILILALVAGFAGLMLGYGIAAALLPDVSGSLRGLYGVAVSGSLTLDPVWALSGLGMAVLGGLAAAGAALWTVYHLPVLAAARPEAWQAAQARQARSGLALAGVFAALGVVLYLVGDSLFAGFATMGCALLTAALALPALLGWLLARLARLARSPLLEWAFADARQQLPGLTLALAALLLALAANIGVGTMVGGFRLTFLNWLDQRLAAEAYVRGATEAQSAEIDAWAARQPEIREVLPASAADIVWQGQPLEIRSAVDAATYRQDWPLLEASPEAWDTLFAGQGAMVSEQAANRLGLGLGTSIDLGQGRLEVVGIYADYGNPKGQVMLSRERLTADFPTARRAGTGLRLAPEEVGPVLTRLTETFQIPPENVIDQTALKSLARGTFERTFAITAALNVLTLMIASVALFTSLLTLVERRIAALAPVWAVGIARRRLAVIEMGKTLLLAGLTAVMAIPVGLVLAWLLVSVINVKAFGWRLPLVPFPDQWLTLGVLSIAMAAAAAFLPMLSLARTAPTRLLKVFSNAR